MQRKVASKDVTFLLFMSKGLEKEIRTVQLMIEIFCKRHHGGELCEACRRLSAYTKGRIEKCTFGVDKPVCAECTIHCFKPDMRAQIREVMRFSGPRMAWKHPMLAMHHLMRKMR